MSKGRRGYRGNNKIYVNCLGFLGVPVFFPRRILWGKPRDSSSHSWMAFLVNLLAYISVPHIGDSNWAPVDTELAKGPDHWGQLVEQIP